MRRAVVGTITVLCAATGSARTAAGRPNVPHRPVHRPAPGRRPGDRRRNRGGTTPAPHWRPRRAADVLWLPSLTFGVDYLRHDGRTQDAAGNLLDVSRSSFMAGLGPNAVVPVADALFAPLAAERRCAGARRFDEQSTANDTVLSAAEAYFNVQQARGELTAADDLANCAERNCTYGSRRWRSA